MKKITLILMSLIMALVVASPVRAANYDAIPGTQTELTKYLVVNEDAEIPEAEFEFTVTAGAAKEATAESVKVWAGKNPELVKVNGTAESGTVEFVVGEDATPANAVTALGQENATGKKAAKKTIALDFSGVSFDEPGVYRYIVTETDPVAPIRAVDSKITTVDVYVEDVEGVLRVMAYVAYEGEVTAANTGPLNYVPVDMSEWDTQNPEPNVHDFDANSDNEISDEEQAAFDAAHETWQQDRDTEFEAKQAEQLAAVPNGAEAGEKDDKFVNELASANIKFGKEVTGNQGSKDQWFKFTLELSNLGNGTVLTLDMSEAENGVAHENTATSYSKATMEEANKRDDNAKWRLNGQEYDSESLAHAAAIATITAGADENEGKFIFDGKVFDTEAEAEAAAKAACRAPLDGQQIIADAQGNATVEVYLHDGMYVTLKGLPEGATYSLTEENAAGYNKIEKITQEVNGTRAYEDAVSGTIGEKMETKPEHWTYAGQEFATLAEANAAAVDAGAEMPAEGEMAEGVEHHAAGEAKAADQNVYTGYTNERSGVIPTGVLMSIGTGVAILGIAGAGLILINRKKEEDEE